MLYLRCILFQRHKTLYYKIEDKEALILLWHLESKIGIFLDKEYCSYYLLSLHIVIVIVVVAAISFFIEDKSYNYTFFDLKNKNTEILFFRFQS